MLIWTSWSYSARYLIAFAFSVPFSNALFKHATNVNESHSGSSNVAVTPLDSITYGGWPAPLFNLLYDIPSTELLNCLNV